MRDRTKRRRALLFLLVAALSVGFGVLTYATKALNTLELGTVDARFAIRGVEPPPADLVVVQIDDVTFSDLRLQFPFPRAVHAQAIRRLAADGAKVIAYDVQFSEETNRFTEETARQVGGDFEDRLADAAAIEDNEFGLAVQEAGNVILVTTEVADDGTPNLLFAPEDLEAIMAKAANAILPQDPGDVDRRISHSVQGLETLAVVAAEQSDGRQIDPSELGGETAYIDFHGPPGTIPAVSFSQVVQGKFPKGTFDGKTVVVGPSAPSLQDVSATSTTGDELMAGVEIQANAISTARRGFPLDDSPAGLDVALIVLLGLVAPLASLRLSPLVALAAAVVLGVAYTLVTYFAFTSEGLILSFVYPIAALLLSTVGTLTVHYTTAAFERQQVRNLFARFVPESVVGQVLDEAGGELRLGGVQREGTVMFSDLRGFTSFAESLPVDRVIEVLNRYLTEMSDAILDNGGTLVAYMGDGIMAVFGAPVAQPDHADRAVAAARQMLGPRLGSFNQYLRDEGLGEGFRMGVGLNTGPVMSGNVGSERRLEYTAIGDTTNTSARLEGMTKGTPNMLFMAESTKENLQRPVSELVFVDEFEVRGREAKIRIWSIPDEVLSAGTDQPAPAAAAAAGAGG